MLSFSALMVVKCMAMSWVFDLIDLFHIKRVSPCEHVFSLLTPMLLFIPNSCVLVGGTQQIVCFLYVFFVLGFD